MPQDTLPPDARRLIAQHGPERVARAAGAMACRAELIEFIRRFWRVNDRAMPFVEGWPLEAMCEHLTAVTNGWIKRLLINVPPGSTKSLTSSVFWPAWEWGPRAMPHLRYICASYSAHLTLRDNRRFRRIVLDSEYQANWGNTVHLDLTGNKQISNLETGWKLATSVEGVGTGERGNRIIIDDANNPKDVESDTVREGVQFWLREVMPDRLNDLANDVIVCIQQRTHEGDATGTLLDLAGLDYVHLMIPAEYDPTRHCVTVLRRDEEGQPLAIWEDPRGLTVDDEGDVVRLEGLVVEDRNGPSGPTPAVVQVIPGSPAEEAAGELFWPERIPRAQIEEQQIAKGPVGYSGQYQQLPNPRGGGILKREWWKLWASDTFPDFIMVVASLDTAYKEKEENDYNALTVWGIFLGETSLPLIILKRAWRTRCSFADLVSRVSDTCLKDKVDTLLIEDKARGHDVATELRREHGSRKWTTILTQPTKSKIDRASAVQPLLSGDWVEDPVTGLRVPVGGLVYAPDQQWAEDVITECEKFPKGEHDDYVDTVTQFLAWARKSGEVKRAVEHAAEEREKRKFKKPAKPPYDV